MLRLMYGIGFISMSSADTEYLLWSGAIREQSTRDTEYILVAIAVIGVFKLEEPAQGILRLMDKQNGL